MYCFGGGLVGFVFARESNGRVCREGCITGVLDEMRLIVCLKYDTIMGNLPYHPFVLPFHKIIL